MDFYLLDKDFNRIDIIDDYESAIWTDRYLEPGDFELYILIDNVIPRNISVGKYLWFNESEHLMIIESIKIETDIEDGNKLIVSGRSLESILDRRIVWNKTKFEKDRYDAVKKTEEGYSYKHPDEEGWFEKRGNDYILSKDTSVVANKTYYRHTVDLQTAVRRLLDENVINPSDSARAIPNFNFIASSDERITSLRLDAEYHGEDLLKIIKDICDTHKIGFKITTSLNSAGIVSGNFNFRLYVGSDKSYDPRAAYSVIFSPSMDNFLNSNYSDDMKPHKNVTLCEGPEEDTYDKVSDLSGDENPKEEGWYKFVDNEYVQTEDEEVRFDVDYYEKDERLKTRVKTVVGNATGLSRREIYTDCSSASREGNLTYDEVIPSEYDDFDELSPKEEGWYKKIIEHGEEYYVKTQDEAPPRRDVAYYIKNTHSRDDNEFKLILAQMGKKKLSENKRAEDFDGEVDYTNGIFKYGKDYKIGDIVQLVNDYGFQGKTRVMEYTFSDNTSDGLKCYPKFEMIEEEG